MFIDVFAAYVGKPDGHALALLQVFPTLATTVSQHCCVAIHYHNWGFGISNFVALVASAKVHHAQRCAEHQGGWSIGGARSDPTLVSRRLQNASEPNRLEQSGLVAPMITPERNLTITTNF